MMEAISFVWHEEHPEGDWSVGLRTDGRISLNLRQGNAWVARPLSLHIDIPQEVFDVLVKHKGRTRRHLATLPELN
jgi:hypothetical protein